MSKDTERQFVYTVYKKIFSQISVFNVSVTYYDDRILSMKSMSKVHQRRNTLTLRQNGCHFADNIFKRIFLNANCCILKQTSLRFIPEGLIDNMSVLVQVRAWHRTGDKPLPEQMLTQFIDGHLWMRHQASMS